jgi:uncharacterized protein (DUF305 family)
MLDASMRLVLHILPLLSSTLGVDLKFSLDLFAGESAYYKVEGYTGNQPTLTMDLNTEYWLIQKDVTNWMHPLGLAYQPDGAHDVKYPGGEGAPEVVDSADTSVTPGYAYTYYIKHPGATDFTAASLDDYEPLFFYPLSEWVKYEFKIKVQILKATFAKEILYFCHIHNKMSGKILINGGVGSSIQVYAPHVSDAFDTKCGTYRATEYQNKCVGQQFLCGDGMGSDFAQCMQAIDCKMYLQMQSQHIEPDYATTFMHQMIPHHQNAVNMARILLKKTPKYGDGSLKIDISESAQGEHDGVQDMLLDMINTQNYQVSEMRKWLLENNKAANSTCRRLEGVDSGVSSELPFGIQRLPETLPNNMKSAQSPKVTSEATAIPPRQLHAHQELNFSFDYFACEMGYFKVAGYSGVQPKLALDLNTEYWLIQKDDSNWMHPLGLAYQPDGAHDVKYPGSKGTGAPEVTDSASTADTPGYEYTYYIKKPGANSFEAKTLDDYEPLFFYPYDVWAKYEFKIKVKITNASFAGSIAYFCHIHNKMSGLITIKGGSGSQVQNLYDPCTTSPFDQQCGVEGASLYSTKFAEHCPSKVFVCGAKDTQFARCMNAIDCQMNHEMTVLNIGSNPVATFMQQMIPHHQNAVNMARILMKKMPVYGDNSIGVNVDETEAGAKDGLSHLMIKIINVQNYQISEMRKWLLENNFAEAGAACKKKELKFSLDLFAGEFGYYKVEGHSGVQPTLTMDLNTEYWLIQKDVTNWMHPLGLAYKPDGAHDVKYPGGEGAPEVVDSASISTTPGYVYTYYIKHPGAANFVAASLDDYEPLFFYPLSEWAKYEFKIKVQIFNASFAKEILYFCHIHNKMSGKILINGGVGPSVQVYAPKISDAFDTKCGTYHATEYRNKCAGQQFLCGEGMATDFAQCMQAIDCKMYLHMQSQYIEPDYATTFMHQMIPHHQNAANMARVLLKKTPKYGDGSLKVDISESAAGEHDGIQDMLLDMINTQNYQVSEMRKWLLENNKAANSTCRRLGDVSSSASSGVPSGLKRIPETLPNNMKRGRSTQVMSEAEATPPRQLHAHQELNFSFDYFACEMGYFKVAGYSGVQPKLALDLNTEYWLIQKDDSNWMHPLGLAYQPDGAHDVKYPGSKGQGAPEVTDSANTADTPGYEYTYYIKKPGASNFEAKTLDDYEPLFFYPYDVWSTYEFKIKVKITNSNFAGSIVYFCHIHNKMSGLITVNGGTGSQVQNLYDPCSLSAFDSQCGVEGASLYSTKFADYCPSKVFVCGAKDTQFAKCMNAIDCQMNHEMTVLNIGSNPVATFMHQMIPHHQNAVNMARILLKKMPVYGDNSIGVNVAETEAGAKDGLSHLMIKIINVQNYQISEMRKWLLENSFNQSGNACTSVAVKLAGTSSVYVPDVDALIADKHYANAVKEGYAEVLGIAASLFTKFSLTKVNRRLGEEYKTPVRQLNAANLKVEYEVDLSTVSTAAVSSKAKSLTTSAITTTVKAKLVAAKFSNAANVAVKAFTAEDPKTTTTKGGGATTMASTTTLKTTTTMKAPYVEGTLQSVQAKGGWIASEAEAESQCDADPECKGIYNSGKSSQWSITEPGPFTFVAGGGDYPGMISVKVKTTTMTEVNTSSAFSHTLCVTTFIVALFLGGLHLRRG